MLRLAKKSIRSFAQQMGYEIVRSTVDTNNKLRAGGFFSHLEIDIVIDVGANTGQFAQWCRHIGYRGEILSIEPLRDAHASLLQNAASDPHWTIAERMALGDHEGEVEINVAGNSVSSSVLEMRENLLDALPQSKYIERQVVPMRRLDNVVGKSLEGRRIFLKLDVQGFEPQVLRGAGQLLSEVTALQLEMSLVSLYHDEIAMPEMYSMLERHGFLIWDLEPGFRHPRTGQLLQVDGLFVNKGKAGASVAYPAN